eukprot:gene13084-3688_t
MLPILAFVSLALVTSCLAHDVQPSRAGKHSDSVSSITGMTYSNACEAAAAKERIAYPGACTQVRHPVGPTASEYRTPSGSVQVPVSECEETVSESERRKRTEKLSWLDQSPLTTPCSGTRQNSGACACGGPGPELRRSDMSEDRAG